jgi:hypothetical protein
MKKKLEKFVHVGEYVARVEIEVIYSENSWSPCMQLKDAQKLDEIRQALKTGDFNAASKLAHIFKLTPITLAA